MEGSMDLLTPLNADCDQFSTQSSPRDCPSLTDSFLSNQHSSICADGTRRPSFSSTAINSPITESPSWYSSHSANTSPTTPMTSMPPFSVDEYRMKLEQVPDGGQIYSIPQNGLPDLDLWISSEDTDDMSHLTSMTAVPLMNLLGTSEHSSYCVMYPQYAQTVGMSNPALSRSIFDIQDNVNVGGSMPIDDSNLHWSALTSSPPQTIAPSAAFQPLLVSSPITKYEPSTPIRMSSHSSTLFRSSPIGLVSPPIVPSQHEDEDIKYEAEHDLVMSELGRHRGGLDRLHRRAYARKRHVGQSNRPKPVSNRSGMDCDVVIAQNEFACGYPDCIDKQTGNQKRFKRAEHKKRHEKTVHEKERHGVHHCWVPGCKTLPFTRTDNLKSHLKNTHGKKSANQRNRYVATQDKNSEYYDPDWEGDLTEKGYPVADKDEPPVRSKL